MTGGASGIGMATATLFASEGARVSIGDVDEEKGMAVAARLRNLGRSSIFVKVDVSKSVEVRTMVEETVRQLGSLQILVNSAGIIRLGAVPTFAEADYSSVMDVNVKGTFLACKYAIPEMIAGGSIINIASALGLKAYEGHGAYCASKAAIIQLTKVLALECAKKGIRVNALCPGPVETPMLAKEINDSPDPAQSRSLFLEAVPLGRFGKPNEVANIALFLASDEASYLTGAAIPVDGGESLT